MSHNPFASTAVTDAQKNIESSVRQVGVPNSDLYEVEIKAAYLITNGWDSAKTDLALHFTLPSGYEHRISLTVLANGTPMTKNSKTGETELLWTYQRAALIVGAATDGKDLAELFDTIQTKKIELYNFEKKQNVLSDVQMVMGLVGKKLLLGLQKKVSNKVEKIDDEWVDLPERKETLEFGVAASIADRRTYNEMNSGAEPEDADKWEKLNKGKTWDAYKEVANAGAGTGTPPGVAQDSAPVHDFGAD